MSLRRAQRRSYLISHALGDVNAAKRGRLTKRIVKRRYHRGLIGLLRKLGAW